MALVVVRWLGVQIYSIFKRLVNLEYLCGM